jgi:chaperonin GroES
MISWFLYVMFSFCTGWTMIPSKSAFSDARNNLSKQLPLLFLQLTELDSSSSEDFESSSTLTMPSVKSTNTLDGQEIRQPITAVNDIVIVKVKDALSATGGGILLPDQSKQRPTEGLVVKAGPGKFHPFTGIFITNPIQEGMSVV